MTNTIPITAMQPAPIGADALRVALARLIEMIDAYTESPAMAALQEHITMRQARAALASAAQPEREPHPPHRDCGCAECAPSFEPDAAAPKAAPDPRTPTNMRVNGGALILALNVLRRAGKNEVADELEKTAAPAVQGDALDTARIDYLASLSEVSITRVRYVGAEKTIYEVAPINDDSYDGDTLREAIDAARAAEKEENHD